MNYGFRRFFQHYQVILPLIEMKGMTFDHDFGYSFPLFSSLLKNTGKKKRRKKLQNRHQNSCLSVRSLPLAAITPYCKSRKIISIFL